MLPLCLGPPKLGCPRKAWGVPPKTGVSPQMPGCPPQSLGCPCLALGPLPAGEPSIQPPLALGQMGMNHIFPLLLHRLCGGKSFIYDWELPLTHFPIPTHSPEQDPQHRNCTEVSGEDFCLFPSMHTEAMPGIPPSVHSGDMPGVPG